jgi:hypothetical protein
MLSVHFVRYIFVSDTEFYLYFSVISLDLDK